MIEISPETFAQFGVADERRFVAQLCGLLRDKVDGLDREPPAALEAEVRAQIDRARSFELTSERAIATYVVTAGLLGLDFVEEFPRAREILTSRATPAEKAAELDRFVRTLFAALAG